MKNQVFVVCMALSVNPYLLFDYYIYLNYTNQIMFYGLSGRDDGNDVHYSNGGGRHEHDGERDHDHDDCAHADCGNDAHYHNGCDKHAHDDEILDDEIHFHDGEVYDGGFALRFLVFKNLLNYNLQFTRGLNNY